MTEATDLELSIGRLDGQTAAVDVRFTTPGTDTDRRLTDGPATVTFDFEKLDSLVLDAAAYGDLLGRTLLTGPVAGAVAEARQDAAARGAPLRVRLLVAPAAERLQALRWETLRDPADGSTLLTNQTVLFSRYLTSRDWRPVGLAPKSDLDAVVVVANPKGLDEWKPGGQALAPVDVAGELARARAGLGQMPVVEVADPGTASLAGITKALESGPEVLYLACHGFVAKGEPQLLLEGEDGTAERVAGSELVARLAELPALPRLVVLASCQSGFGPDATSADGGALAGLGPLLAEAGVPAVVAMQGNVSMDTVAAFMPAFFTELDRDGQIDRAVAAARGAVRERPDWWMPVLFMRLRSGRLWYVPGFGSSDDGFERWPGLVNDVRRGRSLPILGPGLGDALLGPREQIARGWAERYRFPMAAHDQDDLADVAQFLWATQGRQLPMDELRDWIQQRVGSHRGELPPDLAALVAPGALAAPADLDRLLTAVWQARSASRPDPYTVLARLPFPVFVTTQPVGLLAAALTAAGKKPRVDYCRWNDDADWPPSPYDDDPSYVPSVDSPLVYHLFGHLTVERSLVLTADSYFDFLIGLTANRASVPSDVTSALSDRALLFLGFRVDEWDFRVVFRSIMNLQGRGRTELSHVAAQIDPEGALTLSPEGARRYFEKYLRCSQVDVYWGSTEAFVGDLGREFDKAKSP